MSVNRLCSTENSQLSENIVLESGRSNRSQSLGRVRASILLVGRHVKISQQCQVKLLYKAPGCGGCALPKMKPKVPKPLIRSPGPRLQVTQAPGSAHLIWCSARGPLAVLLSTRSSASCVTCRHCFSHPCPGLAMGTHDITFD